MELGLSLCFSLNHLEDLTAKKSRCDKKTPFTTISPGATPVFSYSSRHWQAAGVASKIELCLASALEPLNWFLDDSQVGTFSVDGQALVVGFALVLRNFLPLGNF